MKRIGRTLGAAVAVMILMTAAAAATSLWDEHGGSLFSDSKAKFVGDLVTIMVRENTTARNSSSTELTQEEKMESGTGTGFVGQFLEAFGIESSDEYKGEGSTSSGGQLSTTITAEVVDVLSNGNLVIEARRTMAVNDETQMMVLSGVVRPKDIGRDNTILSTKISDVQLRYTGKGPIARRQRPGILNKIFDWIF